MSMRPKNLPFVCVFVTLLVLSAAVAWAPVAAAEAENVEGYPGVERVAVEIWSDGTRLAGDVLRPKGLGPGDELPAIVLCHGWGGTKAHLNQAIGPRFAAAGYVVLAFDYRGWGESDARLVVRGEMPETDDSGYVTVKAQAIRELVDPLDQQEDIDAAITFMEGEPHVDASRIAIWGSSFGGGHVIWRAAHDERVAAVAAQVGAMDQRTGTLRSRGEEAVRKSRIARARGEVAPVPVGDDKPEGLTGSPYYDRFVDFVPVEHAERIEVPVLIIDAENEHYFDIREHGQLVYEKLLGRVPVEYVVLEGRGHYDVYRGKDLDQVMALEIAFFDKHLKGKATAAGGASSSGG